MGLQAKTRLYNIGGDKYSIYIPKSLIEDSQFPFDLKTSCKRNALEIVVMPTKIEGLGKLLIRLTPKEQSKKV